MSNSVITVENLAKSYLVGHQSADRGRYMTFREAMNATARNYLRKTVNVLLRGGHLIQGDTLEEFWALKDIEFEVNEGEVLGIIGRNGAGKSTLLKILSRITEPTSGRVTMRGRVASLLEVGTGFHPELTGRENIFLNGAIMGLSRADIRRRFDEIVAFAEVEKFLDTPVKRYSSGMYVRLAFAVAAHLDPDILIVDEVLAVGDAEFQKKCLGKMDETAKTGRTVLFVSHDLRRAASLCTRGILLNSGRIVCEGSISKVIDYYLASHKTSAAAVTLVDRTDRSGSGDAQFDSIEISSGGIAATTVSVGRSFEAAMQIAVKRRIGPLTVRAIVMSSDGVAVYELVSNDDGLNWSPDLGNYVVSVVTEKMPLYPGTYFLDLWVGDRTGRRVDYVTHAISFSVTQEGGGGLERELDRGAGLVVQAGNWSYRTAEPAERLREAAPAAVGARHAG